MSQGDIQNDAIGRLYVGGNADYCPSGVDLFLMRNHLLHWLVVVLALCSDAWAGSASATFGGGFSKSSAGVNSVKGASATAANGAFNTPATVTAAGQAVNMGATATMAANAAAFAVSSIRLNPAGLMVNLAAAWLIPKGLEYINNQWMKNKSGANETGLCYQGNGNFCLSVYGSVAEASRQACISGGGSRTGATLQGSPYNYRKCTYANGTETGNLVSANCNGGATTNVGGAPSCGGAITTSAPATDADFAAAGTGALPDPVAQELARKDVPIPVNDPVLAPTPQVVPYGQPYVDPSTGKTVQTMTRVTPDPLPGDPGRVRLETYNIEISAAPAPLPGDPVPVPQAEQPKDACLDNPDRVGCLNAGSPENVDLSTYSVPFTVTPVSVGGAGACPPNPVLQVHGMSLTINYGPMCDAASWLKPLILALAWFAAAGIIAGTVKES